MASGALDTAVLIWDVAPAQRQTGLPAKQLDAKELERLWAELAGADARKAYTAIWTLVSAPEQAVALLKDRLKPAPKTDPKRIRQLIAELDSDKFAVREAAFKALQDLGLEAEPALRKALQEYPSADVQKRIDVLLSGPPPRTAPSPDMLRRLRALTALEHIGSEEARQVLMVLANGAPGALLTRDAKAALERLGKRNARK